MGAPCFLEDFYAGTEVEVVGVVEYKSDSECFDLLRCEPLDRRLSCHRHKGREHCDAVG